MSTKTLTRERFRVRLLSMTQPRVCIAARLLGSVAMFACISWLPLHAEDAFPYTATITSADAIVRSGPGEEFYATDRAREGQAVEVYRHDGDAWCAIRPLETSFSWVAAEHLEITDNPKLARVINVPVKTRVGSHMADAFDVEYISLRKGEIVELLGSEVRTDAMDELPIRWFKIAPPAGEFRFVHSRFLTRDPAKRDATLESETPSPDSEPAELEPMDIPTYSLDAKPQQPAPLDTEVVANAEPLAEQSVLEQELGTGFSEAQAIQKVAYEAEVSDDVEPEAPASEPSAVQEEGNTSADYSNVHVNAVTWEAVGVPTDPLSAPEPRSFVDRYNALNIMLSRAILGDIESWKLDKLQAQTQRLMELAESVDEQKLGQGLADKVSEFQSLQNRSRDLEATGEPGTLALDSTTKPLPLPKLPVASEQQAAAIAQVSADIEMPQRMARPAGPNLSASELKKREPIDNSIFDASGQLIAVKSRRAEIPKYAIANRHGEIIKFVSTKDGSSLSHLVNKEVGVLGKNGFLRSLNKPHVVADRVLVLQR